MHGGVCTCVKVCVGGVGRVSVISWSIAGGKVCFVLQTKLDLKSGCVLDLRLESYRAEKTTNRTSNGWGKKLPNNVVCCGMKNYE